MNVYKGSVRVLSYANIEAEAENLDDLKKKLESRQCRFLEFDSEPGFFELDLFFEGICDTYDKSEFDELVAEFGYEAVDAAYMELYIEDFRTDSIEDLRNWLNASKDDDETP